MTYIQTTSIELDAGLAGATLYAKIYDTLGAQVGSDVTTGFVDYTLGKFSFTYTYPTAFSGTLAIHNSVGDTLLAISAINQLIAVEPDPPIEFVIVEGDGYRQMDINVFVDNTTRLVWRKTNTLAPSEIVFTIKNDNSDLVADAVVVVSLTNGCETINGQPSGDASLSTITYDDYFVYIVMESDLTLQFQQGSGSKQYDVKLTNIQGIRTIAYGLVNVVLGGTP